MNESFHATMKLITGEEILAEVVLECENDTEFFLVSDPIIISETVQIDHQKGVAISGLVPKKWMLYSVDNTTIIYKQHVVSISELDKFGIEFAVPFKIDAEVGNSFGDGIEVEFKNGKPVCVPSS